MHPTQHSTHGHPASAGSAVRQITRNLSRLHLNGAPRHRAVLAHAAEQCRPFDVKPAPMPGREISTGEGK